MGPVRVLEKHFAPLKDLELSQDQRAHLQDISKQYTRQLLVVARDYQQVVSHEQRLSGRRAVRRAMLAGQLDKDELRGVYQSAAGITDEHKSELIRLKREMLVLECEAKDQCVQLLTDDQIRSLGYQPGEEVDLARIHQATEFTTGTILGIDPSVPPRNALIPDLDLSDNSTTYPPLATPEFVAQANDEFDVDELSGDTESYDMSLMGIPTDPEDLPSFDETTNSPDSTAPPSHPLVANAAADETVSIHDELETAPFLEPETVAAFAEANVRPEVEELDVTVATMPQEQAAPILESEPQEVEPITATAPVEPSVESESPRESKFNCHENFAEIELQSAADLLDAVRCDEVRWAATSAPVSALSGDRRFYEFFAETQSDRIYADDLRTAVRWMADRLVTLNNITHRRATLELAHVNQAHPDGAAVVAVARRILAKQNCADQNCISLEQIRGNPNCATELETVYSEDTVFDRPDNAARRDLIERLQPKIDQYFRQCAVVAFDSRLTNRIGPSVEQWNAVDWNDSKEIDLLLEQTSIATPRSDSTLRWDEPLNPFYANDLLTFRTEVLQPMLFADTQITQQQWIEIKQHLSLSIDETTISPGEERATALLEKLVLYQAHLLDLANSFVSFSQLFEGSNQPLSEMGSLVIDGQRFSLAMPVDDHASHRTAVRKSYVDLLYAQVGDQTMALPILSGEVDEMDIDTSGVFEFADGRQATATVTDIARNPAGGWTMLKSVAASVWNLIRRVCQILFVTSSGTNPSTTQSLTSRILRTAMRTFGGLLVSAVTGLFAFLAYLASFVHPLTLTFGALLLVVLVLSPIIVVGIRRRRRRSLKRLFDTAGWITNAPLRVTPKMVERHNYRRQGHSRMPSNRRTSESMERTDHRLDDVVTKE